MISQKIGAMILARGGPKSKPLKNMKYLGGCPLIDYSISASKNSPEIDRFVFPIDHSGIGGD